MNHNFLDILIVTLDDAGKHPDSPAKTVTLPSGTPLWKSPLIKKFKAKFPVDTQSVGSLKPMPRPSIDLVIDLRNFEMSNGRPAMLWLLLKDKELPCYYTRQLC